MKTNQFTPPGSSIIDENEAKMLHASQLYGEGKLSLGEAAEFVGLSKRAFMEILIDFDVSIFNPQVSETDKVSSNTQFFGI